MPKTITLDTDGEELYLSYAVGMLGSAVQGDLDAIAEIAKTTLEAMGKHVISVADAKRLTGKIFTITQEHLAEFDAAGSDLH